MTDIYDLAIVGAGLSALSFLRARGPVGLTAVIDYQDRAGGFLRPALPDPALPDASELVASFQLPAGVETLFASTAVGLLPSAGTPPHTVLVRDRAGTRHVRAARVLIASGGLEITREHDQIPGPRPAGVVTPIFVHQLLDRGWLPGSRAVVYGSSRYAAATKERLATAGTEATLVPSEEDGSSGGADVVEVRGFPRVQEVVLRRDGAESMLPADLLVYARGMVANTLWLKGSGVELDDRGAVVMDERYQTNIPRVHAIGTVVAPDLDHSRSIAMGEDLARLWEAGP
ncbi:MAG TPA: FAD-dependent oxidoreductase [Chloroflexota bacterium]|nr:FAD-dependent oxidoreductase [Chloroflexota bacterium]